MAMKTGVIDGSVDLAGDKLSFRDLTARDHNLLGAASHSPRIRFRASDNGL